MRRLVGAIAVIISLLALAPAAMAADANGSVKGNLQNITAGGSSVADQEVTLTAYSQQGPKGQKTARSDQQGKFTFDGLETGPEVMYQLTVQFQEVTYFSDPIVFPADKPDQTVTLQVTDSTTSDDVLKVLATHFLIEPSADGIAVSEIVIVRNTGDKSYLGSKEIHEGVRETLRFALPAGAENVEYGDGFIESRVFPVDGGFVETWPVYPGDSQRIYRYDIPVKGDSASFSTKIPLAADQVNALVVDNGAQVSISNLPNQSNPTSPQGEKFLMFSGENLAAGTELQFKLDRLPKASGSQTSTQVGLWPLAAGGVVLVALIALVVVLRLRRRRKSEFAPEEFELEEMDESEESPEDELAGESEVEAENKALEAEKTELVAAIAQLDDAFEQEKIGSEEYGRLRAEKKRRLVDVVNRQRSLDTIGSGR